MMIIETILALAVSVFCSVILGKFFSLTLPTLHPHFDRKPFNCRPCLTFHLTWIMATVFALIALSWQLFLLGIAVALVVYVIIRAIENQKIIK